MKRQILEPIEIATSQPTKTMWDIVLKTYSDVMEAAEEAYFSKAKSKAVIFFS